MSKLQLTLGKLHHIATFKDHGRFFTIDVNNKSYCGKNYAYSNGTVSFEDRNQGFKKITVNAEAVRWV